MNRLLYHTPFAAGLLAITWVGAGYLPGHPLALGLVALIGAFFLMGALELHRFQQATMGLTRHLAETTEPPPALEPWLAGLHAGLHHAVRLRVQGERVGLPGPALTPYLAGLLVLLGMLGTFLGMVVTLQGTGLALQGANDVDAIRASLVAPVRGLGLAFGTSVAGVAASAMLGLMSALARRARLQAVQQLDARIAGPLRGFSQAHRRELSLHLLQSQTELMAGTLPALVGQLQGMAVQMERQGQALHEDLLASQARFQAEAQSAYTRLAQSVDASLQTRLVESARQAGAVLESAVQATLAGLAQQAGGLQRALATAAQDQVEGAARQVDRLAAGWGERVGALLDGLAQARQAQEAAAQTRAAEHLAGLQAGLLALGDRLQQQALQQAEWQARQQQQVCTTLERSAAALTQQAAADAQATIAEVARLVQMAGEAPRAAAEVVAELRQALAASLAHDNTVLDERNRLLGTLAGLLDAVNHASTEQRQAIDALVSSTRDMLDGVGTHFAERVESGSHTLQAVAAQVTGSAAEVASLGEGFAHAVQAFGIASGQLGTQLQRIESALGQSMARSDEQLAYYVAQARELIDLTLGAQRHIVDDLQRLQPTPA